MAALSGLNSSINIPSTLTESALLLEYQLQQQMYLQARERMLALQQCLESKLNLKQFSNWGLFGDSIKPLNSQVGMPQTMASTMSNPIFCNSRSPFSFPASTPASTELSRIPAHAQMSLGQNSLSEASVLGRRSREQEELSTKKQKLDTEKERKPGKRGPVNVGSRTSSFRGVCWSSRDKKWRADIRYAGRLKFLGCFDEELEAAHAYDAAVKELLPFHKAFKKANFPEVLTQSTPENSAKDTTNLEHTQIIN